jgi:TolB-like protein/DNA-binding winged helix-turn-helix (wHTH) protein
MAARAGSHRCLSPAAHSATIGPMPEGAPDIVHLPSHRVDLHGRRLLRADGSEVTLRPQAMDLLCDLARHAGEVVTKRDLLDRVWPDMVVTDDSLVQAVGDARRAIGDERHAVIQTVPRRGYRLIAAAAPLPAVEAVPAVTPDAMERNAAGPSRAASAAEPAVTSLARSKGDRRPTVRFAAGAALLLLALTGAVAVWGPWRDAGTPALTAVTPDRPPIAVLDFSDPAAPIEDQQMARAYAEELTGELARNADLSVIAAQSSFAAGARGESLQKVAERLRVGYLVTGSLRRDGEQLRLLAQLVDGRDARVVWTERHDLAAPQVYAVRDVLVARIATSLHSTMRSNQESVALQRPPASMDVYAMTMRGITLKHRFTPQATAEGRALMERVVALDPQYAPGWLYLGYINGVDWAQALSGPRRPEMLRQAIEQIEHAIALDPRLSAAFGALANFYPFAGRHDDAVRAGRRCVELAPSDAECMIFLAGALTEAGDPQAALPLARRAMAMNPLPPSYVQRYYGATMWGSGLLDEALGAFDACVQAAPRYGICRFYRAIARAEAGRIDEARTDLAAWQTQVGPLLEPETMAASNAGPRAQALVERRLAALKVMQGAALATAKP